MSNQYFDWHDIDRSGVDLDFDTYIDLPSLVEPRAIGTPIPSLDGGQQTMICTLPITDICNNDIYREFPNTQTTSTNESLNLNGSVCKIGLFADSFPRFPVASDPSPTTPCNDHQYSINPKKTLIKRSKTGRRLDCSPSPAFRFTRPITPSVSSRSISPPSSACGSEATIKPLTTTDNPDPFISTINITSREVSKALSYLQPNIRREYEEKLIELEYSLRAEYNEKNEVELHRVREECRVEFEAVLEQRMWELERNYERQLDEMRVEFEATLKERMEEVQAICNETVEEKDDQLARLKKRLQQGTIRNIKQTKTQNRKGPIAMRLKPQEKRQSEEDESWRTQVIRVERPLRKTQEISTLRSEERQASVVPSIIEISDSDDPDDDAKHLSDGEIDEASDKPSSFHKGDDDVVDVDAREDLSEGEIDETSCSPNAPNQEMKLNGAQKISIFNLQLEYALERARLLDALEEIRTCREKIMALERERQQLDELDDEIPSCFWDAL